MKLDEISWNNSSKQSDHQSLSFTLEKGDSLIDGSFFGRPFDIDLSQMGFLVTQDTVYVQADKLLSYFSSSRNVAARQKFEFKNDLSKLVIIADAITLQKISQLVSNLANLVWKSNSLDKIFLACNDELLTQHPSVCILSQSLVCHTEKILLPSSMSKQHVAEDVLLQVYKIAWLFMQQQAPHCQKWLPNLDILPFAVRRELSNVLGQINLDCLEKAMRGSVQEVAKFKIPPALKYKLLKVLHKIEAWLVQSLLNQQK